MIDRRQFALASTLMLGQVFNPRNLLHSAEQRALQEKRLVELGLKAMARAPELSYFADGHQSPA